MMNTPYFFDVLPCHPQPQPLESFTSYLIRIAEANVISQRYELKPFFSPHPRIESFADYPPLTFGMLPAMTTVSESELLKTTFHHLSKKFTRVYHQARYLGRFLSGVIASSLRFCPLCLQETPYYSLTWRFLTLSGCPKHSCRLLECCPHCGCVIPLFAEHLHLGICPTCEGDLRICTASKLTEEEWQLAVTESQEIEFLLRPSPWETADPTFIERLGREFAILRQARNLKQLDVKNQTILSFQTIEAIEYGRSGSTKGTILRRYVDYANYLEVPLSQIFMNALQREEGDQQINMLRGKLYLFSEVMVMKQVQEAARQIEDAGEYFTIKAICAMTGLSREGLYKHDQVKAFVQELVREAQRRRSHKQHLKHEDELLGKAQQLIQELVRTAEPVTHHSVSRSLGISPSDITHYPRIKRLLDQYVDYALQQRRHTEACEQRIFEKVRVAVRDLEKQHQPITYTAISESIGISSTAWLAYPQVRAFVEQHLDSIYLRTLKEKERREESLLTRVEEALGKLECAGKPVTFQAVGKLLGMGPATLKSYPRVHALIEQRKSSFRFRGRRAGRSEAEVLIEAQRVIPLLVERGQSVNYTKVAREIGMDRTTLITYPGVKALLDEHLQSYRLYQQQHFVQCEEQLLGQVEAAIAELEARAEPVTQRAICKMVGKSRSTLKQYPRISALLVRKATRHHMIQRLRTQPTEEELVRKVEEAIDDLSSEGKPITQATLGRMVRISPEVLMQYPRVVILLEQQYEEKKRQQAAVREEEWRLRVQKAIGICKASEQPITTEGLSSMVGAHRISLARYPSVKELMTQAVAEDRQQRNELRFQRREEELLEQVLDAIQQLQNEGKRVTIKDVARKIHVSASILYDYPQVKIILERARIAQRTASGAARS